MRKLTLIIFMALLLWVSPIEGARTYIVDDDGFANYKTIGGAVVAANNGDTIYVKPGFYREEVTLNKTLSLMPLTGESGPIVLRGDGIKTGITIVSDGCSLKGFTLQNFTGPGIDMLSSDNTIEGNRFEKDNPGIMIRGSNRNRVAKNILKECRGGVVLWENSTDNRISENEIQEGQVSIMLRDTKKNIVVGNRLSDSPWGIRLMNSSSDEISGNRVWAKTLGIEVFNSTSCKLGDNALEGGIRGISIMNSSSLEVLNCALMNVSLFGITLENSSHNTIQNCSIANSTSAFGLGASSENILAMNRIASTRQTSITLANSHGNTIENNSILDTRESGITLANSSGNAINGNSIAKSDLGILIVDSFANSLRDNRFEEVARSLYVESSRKEDYNNSIDESNLVDGKPIAYFYGASGKLIQNKELALLALAYCDKMTVKNIAITNDALFLFSSHDNKIMENNVSRCFGMLLMDSASNLISGNHLSDNSYSGIFLYSSDANQIDNNTASDNNQNGISLLGCSGNILRDNTAQHNSQTGIWLNFSNDNWLYQNNITDNPLGMEVIYSQGNYIVHNNFINNKEHARDTQGDNSWDLGNVTGGNYWSDHVAKGNPSRNWPRMIKGGKMDNFPFQDASGWDLAGPAAPVAGG